MCATVDSQYLEYLGYITLDTGTTGWVLNVRDKYFKKESCNVISVDWRKLSNTYPFYNIAAANTKSVGYLTASLVNFLGQVHAIQFNKITDSEYAKIEFIGKLFLFLFFEILHFLNELRFCIFSMNFVMATLGLKEMEKFLWEGREKEEKVGKREGQG